jgi:hypothetical protein
MEDTLPIDTLASLLDQQAQLELQKRTNESQWLSTTAEQQALLDIQLKIQQLGLLERKKKFPMNVVECIVGIVLLFFCFSYLSTHPAEKSSIVSGIDVIMQKVHILISRYTSGKNQILENKYALAKSFHEVISLAGEWKCLTEAEIRKLQEYEDALYDMGTSDFEKNEYTYETLLQWFYAKVRQRCDTISTGNTK